MILLRLSIGRAVLSCATIFALARPALADDLVSIYVQALDGNPVYQSALAEYQQAVEAKPQALAKLLPQIAASGEYDAIQQTISGTFFVGAITPDSPGIDNNREDTFNNFNYVIGLSQALFHKDLLVALSESELTISRAGLLTYSAQNALRLGVAGAYFAALTADDNLRFLSAEKDAVGKILEQTRDKASSGIVAEGDVKTALAQYDLAEADLIAARNGVAVSRAELELWTGGKAPGPLKTLSANFLPLPPQPDLMADWIERAKTNNLQVQAQRLSTEIARKEVERAYALRWPTLDLLASHSYTYADGGLSRGIGSENNHGRDDRIGVKLKIPIFSGGAVNSGIRETLASVMRAEADENARRGAATAAVQIAFLNSSAGIAKITALKQAVISTTAAEDAARVGSEVGTKTSAELLLAVRGRYKAERDYATARYDYLMNTLKLREAAGSLNHADLLAINRALQ